jgi:hypothetical protein
VGGDGGNRWRITRLAALLLFLLIAAQPALPADATPYVEKPLLDRTGRAAQDLASHGRRIEAEIVADVVSELHAPQATVVALRESLLKTLLKAKAAPLPILDAAKSIAKLAADLAATLPALAEEPRAAVAKQVLRLDGVNRAAHEALGHVERAGVFIPASCVQALQRRAEIQVAVQNARKLHVETEVVESWMPILESTTGRKGIAVRCGEVSVHSSTHTAEQLTRQLEQGLRAAALSNWLLNGELEVPKVRRNTLVFTGSVDAYKKAALEAKKAGDISQEGYDGAMKMGGFYAASYDLENATFETHIGISVYMDVLNDIAFEAKSMLYAQPCIRVGHMNWVLLNFLGLPMPNIIWTERPEDRKGVTSDTPQAAAERDEMTRIAKAGLAGSRAYVKWLTRRGEDPVWSKSMVDQIGKVQGNDLMKSTLVVEQLQETKDLAAVLRDTWGEPPGPAPFEKALGVTLAEFEARWREWLFAGDPPSGLAQTLGLPPVEPVSAADKPVLDYLNALRRKTLGRDALAVGIDRELGLGCRAHAVYLDQHPKQLSAWPDAHEEFPDQQGFTAAGCHAGLSSVIVGPGITAPADAIDGWMATFYHRLPLLEPGLVRIGWGFEKGIAVLDAASLCAPPDSVCFVTWPPSGGASMPRRFPGELPNPVPGEDQSQWGCPVTLQFFGFEPQPDVRMRLYAGAKRGGTEVPCFYSTPQKPTNPEVAPDGAFCLIPKQALAANATYTVAVDGWPKDAAGTDWTFTTGAK